MKRGLSTVFFFTMFALHVSAEIKVVFFVFFQWFQRDVRKGILSVGMSTILLSLSCSFSSVESDYLEVSELDNAPVTIEPYDMV